MCLCGGNEVLCNNVNNEAIIQDESDEYEDDNLKLRGLGGLVGLSLPIARVRTAVRVQYTV